MTSPGGVPRWRRALATVCMILVGFLLPVGLIANWANATLFDSDTFSTRAVELLDSAAVRTELADQLTTRLAEAGNQQAVNLRPAFQLAIAAAINTDTFRSIFRSAIRQTHQSLIAGQSGASLDLSDSISIIGGTLQLPDTAKPGQKDKNALGTSFTDITKRLSSWHVWTLDDETGTAAGLGILGAIALGAAAIALAGDRRRMVRNLGWVVVVDGLVVAGLVLGAEWFAGRLVSSQELGAAVKGAISHGMADLRSIGLWTVGYGVVMAAAARRGHGPGDACLNDRGSGGVDRAPPGHPRGRVALGALSIVTGLVLVSSPWFWLRLAVLATGLWLAYFGVTEILGLVQARSAADAAVATSGRRSRRARIAWTAGVTAALLLVVSGGLVLTSRRAATRAESAGEQRCNGDASLCDLPLDKAVFPGTHNSMSSTLYRDWLFAEHVKTIGGQLDGGVRALLFDTHYGVQSSARFPGSKQPLVVTDRAAELRSPTGEDADIDPAITKRATDLAARFPARADAQRDIYLCHNYCEMGSVTFASALGEIKTFLDSHPDDVVITIIQDATTPGETAAAIVDAGLEDRVYTLEPGKPLPTLGDMIRSGRTLLVFAEGGGPDAPPWYHKAYHGWFQETTYQFDDPSQMDCAPNRGLPDSPLFLMNHWLAAEPPNPNRAAAVNKQEFLERRIRRCLDERGQLPTIVAVDFAERGDLVKTAKLINEALLEEVRAGKQSATGTTPTTVAPGQPPAVPLETPPSGPPVALPTPLTTLTGGNVDRFCQEAPDALKVIGSWALANLAADGGARGLIDLAFASGAARVEDALAVVSPQEIVQQLQLSRDRAHLAVQALRDLGLDMPTINSVADLTQSELAKPEDPDPVVVQEALLGRLRDLVGADRLNAAGQAFAVANPEPPGLFDLGDVSPEVARASGYNCLAAIG